VILSPRNILKILCVKRDHEELKITEENATSSLRYSAGEIENFFFRLVNDKLSVVFETQDWRVGVDDFLCVEIREYDCPASKPLRRIIFGTTSFIFDLWSRPWGAAQLLGLCRVPPHLHPSEGSSSTTTTTTTRVRILIFQI